MSTTTNLDTLKINYLTQAQYDAALANDQINENEIYMTSASSLTPSDVGIHISTSDPTSADGNNGDIWLVYSVPEPEE